MAAQRIAVTSSVAGGRTPRKGGPRPIVSPIPGKHPRLNHALGFRFSDVRGVVERSIERRLGAKLLLVGRRKVSAEMRVKKAHLNIDGRRVNGGIIMAFADTVGAIGAMVNLARGYRTSTLESKTNFFAAGEGPVIVATAVPLHIGRTTMVWQTKVSNADGQMIALVTQTQIVLAPSGRQSKQNGGLDNPPPSSRRQAPRAAQN